MNLHTNQIQFAAPEPVKAQFAHRTNETAKGIAAMADVVMQGAQAKAALDDQLLASRLKTAEQQGLEYIEKAKETDADYELYGQQALNGFTSILDSAPESVRNRFLQRNPTAVENYTLEVNAAVALKTSNQIYNALDKEIARLSSTVLQAPAEQQQAAFETGLSLLNNDALSATQIDNLTYKYKNQVQTGLLNRAIIAEDFDTARTMLDDVDLTSTLSATERMKYKQEINNAIEKKQEEDAAKEEKRIKEENARKEEEIARLEKAATEAKAARDAAIAEKEKAEQQAENARKKEVETISQYVTDTYANLRKAGDFKGAEDFRMSVINGLPIVDNNGVNIGNLSKLTAVEIADLNADMKKIQSDTEDPAARAQSRVVLKEALRPLLTEKKGKAEYDASKMNDATYYDLMSIKANKEMYNNHLSDSDREDIESLTMHYIDNDVDSLLPYDSFAQVRLRDRFSYSSTAPLGDLTPLIKNAQKANDEVVNKGGTDSAYTAKTLHKATLVYNERNPDKKVKPGTREQALLFSSLGMAATDDTSIVQSLRNIGVINGSNKDVLRAFRMTKEFLRRAGTNESTSFTNEDVQNDIIMMINYMNNAVLPISEQQRALIENISYVSMSGVQNPTEVDIDDYVGIQKVYPVKEED